MKLGIIGVQGKMGREVFSLASQDKSIELISSISRKKEVEKNKTFPVDMIIDFSTKEALVENLILAQRQNCPIVIGTTGLEEKEKELLIKASQNIPVFWAPNFSLGMACLLHTTKILSSFLKDFTSHIEETHHTQKKDTPSGSALALKESLEQGNLRANPLIESFRVDDVIGKHSVFFTSEEEELVLSHQANSRAVFAKGSLTAAKFLSIQKPGLYGMGDLLPYLIKKDHP